MNGKDTFSSDEVVVIRRLLRDAARAGMNITINDRFGHPVQPREWFLVPLFVIDEAVARIKDGSITGYVYDPNAAKLVKA